MPLTRHPHPGLPSRSSSKEHSTWPSIGTPVALVMRCCDEQPHASVIADHAPGAIVVAAPLVHPGGLILPEHEERVLVGWPGSTAYLQLPVALVDITNDQALRVWRTRVLGPPARLQRRAYVRSPEARPVRIGDPAVDATMVDLSEGGLRAAFTGSAAALAALEIDGEELVEFDLDDLGIQAPAKIIRIIDGPNGQREIGMSFLALSSADADRIRRHVFAKQARMRAMGLV